MQEAPLSFRWLQVFAVAQACLSLGVVPLLGRQVLRTELVILLILQGVLAVLVAAALFSHYRFALPMAFGFSLLVTLLGIAAIVALPIPSGMMRSTFLFIRGMILLLLLPSLGSTLICLLAPGLRQAVFHLR